MMYALHDYNPELKRQGAFPIPAQKATDYNKQGYGIFYTPNDFNDSRKKENLSQINYWIADIDEGSKADQLSRIDKLIYKPTTVIETKKGYHCYWKAKDATFNNYRTIERGIIKKLNADRGCKDVTRIMRYPGYFHQKDKDNPFLVKIIRQNEEDYSEKEMSYYFPLPKRVKSSYSFDKHSNKKDFKDPEKWDKLFGLSQITQGNRNNELFRIKKWLQDEGFLPQEVTEIIKEINRRIDSLPDREVRQILREAKWV